MKLKSDIPIKFLAILLILDFSIGLGIVYQDSIIELANIKEKDCETSKSYVLIGPRWENFPIEYYIDTSMPPSFNTVLEASFDVWDDLTPTKVFERTFNSTNWDLFVGYFPITVIEGAVGVTGLVGNDKFFSDNVIKTANLILNSEEELINIEFSCEIVPLNHEGPFDIESVTVHEIGHVLGLDHSVDEFATMYAFYIGTFQKTLSQGDIDGFFQLYSAILP